jgi:hypothetical protein
MSYSTRFNVIVNKLCRIWVHKKKGTFDEDMSLRYRKRLLAIISMNPETPMLQVGPALYEIAELIYQRDWSGVINIEMSVYKEYCADDDSIHLFKDALSSCTGEEKETVGDLVADALSIYCEYHLHSRGNRVLG